MHTLSKHTLTREYKLRMDGNYEKQVIWSGTHQAVRCEIIVRDRNGKMLRVEKKRDR